MNLIKVWSGPDPQVPAPTGSPRWKATRKPAVAMLRKPCGT